MQKRKVNEQSVGETKSNNMQREKAGRLIRHAIIAASVVAVGTLVVPAARAASVTAGTGDNITIDNNNISNPPGGTLDPGDFVHANGGGTVSMTNETAVSGHNTSQLVSASGAGSSITGDNVTVDVGSYYIGVLAVNGGYLSFTDSTITGTYEPFVANAPAPGEAIQTVEAQGVNSVVDLTNVTVDTTAYDNGYQSSGISAYGGGTVNLNNVIINSHGDVTYGIMDEADGGHIVGTNTTITTNGDHSYGVFAWGANSDVNLTGGSVTTYGTNSDGILSGEGATINLTDLTVNATDPTSDSVHFYNSSGATPAGTVTADNSTLYGNVTSADRGNFNLTNGSVLNGSIDVPNGNVTIDSSSTWNDTGDSVLNNFTNGNYVFTPPTDPSNPSQYHTLTVNNFIANPGSSITMNVFADGADSTSDQVAINTSYSGSQTQIIPIVNRGSGDLPNDGLVLVQGDGSSFVNGNFVSAPVNSGFYTYTGGFSDTSGDSQFLLSSQLNSTVVGASVLPVLGARTILSTLPSVQDRMHAPRLSVTGTGDGDAQKGIWARLFGGSNKFSSDESADNGFDTSLWAVQAGYDLMAKKDANGGRSYAGLYLAYGNSSGNAQLNGHNVGDVDLNATSVGAYWTKYSPSDLYLSVTGQYSFLNGIKASGGGERISPSGSGFAISLEGGKTLNREKSILIEPQAQLIYSHTNIDDSTLAAGPTRPVATQIHLSNLNSVTGRLGVLFQKNPNSGKNFLPWARVNLWHTFSGNSTMSSPGLADVDTSMKGTSAELTAGFNLLGNKDSKWAVDVAAGYLFNLSGAKNTGWRGNLGAKYNF